MDPNNMRGKVLVIFEDTTELYARKAAEKIKDDFGEYIDVRVHPEPGIHIDDWNDDGILVVVGYEPHKKSFSGRGFDELGGDAIMFLDIDQRRLIWHLTVRTNDQTMRYEKQAWDDIADFLAKACYHHGVYQKVPTSETP